MTQTKSPAVHLAERLCRPQRIGVFGHRGVGKTTLLTMLYREAVGGRLPGLRLAAADSRTANYLSDKVLQLESGQPLPATLGETELRFHLYKGSQAVDLLVMDYQGEHVTLGRSEPIRDFLRECDAVWLCLDVLATTRRDSCLTAEQEVEQIVEDYLSASQEEEIHRPMALVLTKADLLEHSERYTNQLPEEHTAEAGTGELRQWVDGHLGMTRHALESHHPQHALFAVSSLGKSLEGGSRNAESEPESLTEAPEVQPLPDPDSHERGESCDIRASKSRADLKPKDRLFEARTSQRLPVSPPEPAGLSGPLGWLCETLQKQDEARIHRLWELAPRNLKLLRRCVANFARRYPDAPATQAFRKRLGEQQRRRTLVGTLSWAAAAVTLFLSLWTYDAWAGYKARQYAALHEGDPMAVREYWRSYQRWHPTRHLFSFSGTSAETEFLAQVDQRIREQQCALDLDRLQRLAADPDADPEKVWQQFEEFKNRYPEHDVTRDWTEFRDALKDRRDRQRETRAWLAYQQLQAAGKKEQLLVLVERANRFLQQYRGTKYHDKVVELRTIYLDRLDERDYERARAYSVESPINFHTRRDHYRQYLEHHPRGKYVKQARAQLMAINREWDRYDFRLVRDHFLNKPGDIEELSRHCRNYLAAHPEGKYRDKARELLRWGEQVIKPGNYRVTLKSGSFDGSIRHWLSRGPHLYVELKVNGVFYGPSSITTRTYEPEWEYTFSEPIRWKRGDRVEIVVKDNFYWTRKVFTLSSEEDDPLAMRLLSGKVAEGKHRLVFDSDFSVPTMPDLEKE